MLRFVILFLCYVCAPLRSTAQDGAKNWFDFWIGEWRVQWQEQGGNKGTGTNSVIKILDSVVIQENFRAETGALKGYKGISLSVYNSRTNSWHQGYADNNGGYFNFLGSRDGERRIFKTAVTQRDGKQLVHRMVFHHIHENAFVWDWELSEDEGKTWSLKWRIEYNRINQQP